MPDKREERPSLVCYLSNTWSAWEVWKRDTHCSQAVCVFGKYSLDGEEWGISFLLGTFCVCSWTCFMLGTKLLILLAKSGHFGWSSQLPNCLRDRTGLAVTVTMGTWGMYYINESLHRDRNTVCVFSKTETQALFLALIQLNVTPWIGLGIGEWHQRQKWPFSVAPLSSHHLPSCPASSLMAPEASAPPQTWSFWNWHWVA